MNNEHVYQYEGGIIDPDGIIHESAIKVAAKVATAINQDVVDAPSNPNDTTPPVPADNGDMITRAMWATMTKQEKQSLLAQWKLDASALRIVRRTHEAMMRRALEYAKHHGVVAGASSP